MKTCQKTAIDKDEGITSPLLDVGPESNPSISTEPLAIDPGPPTQKSAPAAAPQGPQPILDANHGSSHQQPKHSRSDSGADAEVSAPILFQPPVKRTKANPTSPVRSSSNATGRSHRSRIIIPPRSPLPQRINRVINPGAPDKKRAQRTSEEVAAAAKKKEHLRLQLERLEREKIQMMAEMELEEVEADRLEEGMAIRNITDLAGSKAAGDDDVTMTASEDTEKGDDDESEGPAKKVCSTLMSKIPDLQFFP